MDIAIVTPEAAPFSRTGGLGEVCGAFPRALEELGFRVRILTPRYRGIAASPDDRRVAVPIGARVWRAGVARALLPGSTVPVDFIDQPDFFDRDGLYGHADDATRFIFFARAALEILKDDPPDIVHVHDWPAALVPIYLKTLYRKWLPETASVLTIHNLAHQGRFWHWDMPLTGLDWSHFHWRDMEFHGGINFLKAGLVHADAITTVSPRYAEEIRTPEFGEGLDGVLRSRAYALSGILNGIDADGWNPATDPELPARYDADRPAAKADCKLHLQLETGLPIRRDVPLFGVVNRLVEQKGVDVLIAAMRRLESEDVQFVLCGSGEPRYEEMLRRLHHPRIAVRVPFDPALCRRILGGADFLLMPSRYEPCGLAQMYALRYGAIPIVRAVGGLTDTVEDGRTGFAFQSCSPEALAHAIRRALVVYHQPEARRAMLLEGMGRDFSWTRSARQYLDLYRRLRGISEPRLPRPRRTYEVHPSR